MSLVAQHHITLTPWPDPEGTSARHLLTTPFLKGSHIPCPICGAPIEIPLTLESDIRALAAQLGGEDVNIKLTFHHKGPRPLQIRGTRFENLSDSRLQGRIIDERRG